MANNIQFSIAVHILTRLACGCDREGVTSGHLAESVNTSPSFVRRTLAKLSKVRLVETATGKTGACWLAKSAKDISLLDIYKAVNAPKAFSIHDYPEQKMCFVSRYIKTALEKARIKIQKAMEAGLAEISLAQIVSDMKKKQKLFSYCCFLSNKKSKIRTNKTMSTNINKIARKLSASHTHSKGISRSCSQKLGARKIA